MNDLVLNKDNILQLLINARDMSSRSKVNAIEAFGKSLPTVDLKDIDNVKELSQTNLLTEHLFSPGVYTRILHIPKGCILTGQIHKEPILNIMLKGDISVLIGEVGKEEIERIVAPFICVSPAGSKKIGFAHEDTIWIGCHGTNETDISEIEKRFVAKTDQEYLDHCTSYQRFLR